MAGIMESYKVFVLDGQVVLLTLVFLLALIGVAVFVLGTLRLRSLRALYRSAQARQGGEDLDEILLRQAEEIRVLGQRVASLEGEVAGMQSASRRHIQRCVLERYRAFKDVGGDQSFSLALLDADNNGLVVTSIYGREESRVYAKRVVEGKATHPLSEEERKVLATAVNTKESIPVKQEITAISAKI